MIGWPEWDQKRLCPIAGRVLSNTLIEISSRSAHRSDRSGATGRVHKQNPVSSWASEGFFLLFSSSSSLFGEGASEPKQPSHTWSTRWTRSRQVHDTFLCLLMSSALQPRECLPVSEEKRGQLFGNGSQDPQHDRPHTGNIYIRVCGHKSVPHIYSGYCFHPQRLALMGVGGWGAEWGVGDRWCKRRLVSNLGRHSGGLCAQ